MLRKIYCILFLGLFVTQFAESQVTPDSKIKSFNSRMNTPIDVDIQEAASGASITINNRSYFRYLIQIKFTSVMNLKISPGQIRNYVLPYGIHKLESIPAVDNSQIVDLAFTSTSQICPSNYEKGDFTYLYPIGNQRNMKDFVYVESQTVYLNMFKMKKNDTIFAMRKGIIVNTQENEGLADRLGPVGSFEILHEDGTVMIYNGISRHPEAIKQGLNI